MVITLVSRIDLMDAWTMIAKHCCIRPNIIGYDLINEPSSEFDSSQGYWQALADQKDSEGSEQLCATYQQLIKAISEVDQVTPIILEPSFWAHASALSRLDPIVDALEPDVKSRLLFSFHFYEPPKYTQRRLNAGRYTYPGKIPLWKSEHGGTITIDKNWIKEKFSNASSWAAGKSFGNLVIGETGVARQVPGAQKYLQDVLQVAFELSLPVFIFSFRDADWEAMNYEIHTSDNEDVDGGKPGFMQVIHQAIKRADCKMND